jgi:hypothetical protein
MAEKSPSNTKSLFDSLARLYHQGHLLLMDADKYLGDEGWAPLHTYGIAELSYSLNSPHKWFARWAMRFYSPSTIEGDEPQIDRLLFVSIHFASDAKTGLESTVNEPLVCAGRLLYKRPMTQKEAEGSFNYWMCKYWFIGKPHPVLKGWRKTGQSQWHENLAGSESFAVQLYDITSTEKLRKMVLVPLLTYGKSNKTPKK